MKVATTVAQFELAERFAVIRIAALEVATPAAIERVLREEPGPAADEFSASSVTPLTPVPACASHVALVVFPKAPMTRICRALVVVAVVPVDSPVVPEAPEFVADLSNGDASHPVGEFHSVIVPADFSDAESVHVYAETFVGGFVQYDRTVTMPPFDEVMFVQVPSAGPEERVVPPLWRYEKHATRMFPAVGFCASVSVIVVEPLLVADPRDATTSEIAPPAVAETGENVPEPAVESIARCVAFAAAVSVPVPAAVSVDDVIVAPETGENAPAPAGDIVRDAIAPEVGENVPAPAAASADDAIAPEVGENVPAPAGDIVRDSVVPPVAAGLNAADKLTNRAEFPVCIWES